MDRKEREIKRAHEMSEEYWEGEMSPSQHPREMEEEDSSAAAVSLRMLCKMAEGQDWLNRSYIDAIDEKYRIDMLGSFIQYNAETGVGTGIGHVKGLRMLGTSFSELLKKMAYKGGHFSHS